MAELKLPTKPVGNWQHVRDEWVRAVEQLVADVESWCRANDWPTRRVPSRLSESPIGEYVVPALLIQVDTRKFLLEPIARFVPGADGAVDLYEMPRYDDIANLYLRNGVWVLDFMLAADKVPDALRNGHPPVSVVNLSGPFTAEQFANVVKLIA
jgi:hypothetical protein